MAISKAKKTGEGPAAGEGAGDLDDRNYRHVQQADRCQGLRTAQGYPRSGWQVSRGEEQAGGGFGRGQQGRGPALKGLKGVNSVAFTSGDPVALAKVFAKWAGENAEFQFKLGIVDGKLLNVEEIKALATMPGKEELFCQAAVPHQRSGAAFGHGHQRHGPRPGGCLNQGVEKEKFAAQR